MGVEAGSRQIWLFDLPAGSRQIPVFDDSLGTSFITELIDIADVKREDEMT